MSSSSSSPKMAAATIPNITALRTALDYGDARLPRCATFYDDMRAFRRKFTTSRGVPGVDLHDWKSREGQAGLSEMTIAYLEKDGGGLMFWPDDSLSPNYNKFQYSKDGYRIRRLVKQLFFRLNQQQFRNHKYKHKEPAETKAINQTGHSEHIPIDVDAIILSPGIGLANKPLPVAGKSATPDLPDLDQYLDEPSPGPGRVNLNDADVYDVPTTTPTSPTLKQQFQSINQPSRTAKRGPNYTKITPKGQQAKRQKRQPKPAVEDDFAPASTNSPTGAKWKSPRVRRQPQREGYCGLDEINNRLNSEKALSPEQDGLQRAASPESSTITFRDPNTDTRPPPQPTPVPAIRAHASPAPESAAAPISPTLRYPTRPAATRRDEPDRPQDQPPHPISNTDIKSPTPDNSITKPAAPALVETPSTTASANKPSVNFVYRVVLARKPKTITERWTPRGRFQDKTLAELLKELPFADDLLTPGDDPQGRGLIFTIESECMRTVERVAYNDEGGFASMKRYINTQIREWFARRYMRQAGGPLGGGVRLDVDVLISRMGGDEEDDEVKGGVGDLFEDLEIEW